MDSLIVSSDFSEKISGIFVDVGAHDGIRFSNSFHFEKNLGWSGICIEPLPSVFEQLKVNRNSINLNCAVDDVEGTFDFIANTGYTEMLSGIARHYDRRHHDRKDREIKYMGGSSTVIQVGTRRLESIFEEYNINKIDYISIDVEGGEFSVIKSINFNKVFIDIVGFEGNYSDLTPPIIKYLEEKGYNYIGRLECDIFMIHKDSEYNQSHV